MAKKTQKCRREVYKCETFISIYKLDENYIVYIRPLHNFNTSMVSRTGYIRIFVLTHFLVN